jgi:hypothetical protein
MKPKDFKDSWAGEPSKFTILPHEGKAAVPKHKVHIFRTIWSIRALRVSESAVLEPRFECMYAVRLSQTDDTPEIIESHKATIQSRWLLQRISLVDARWISEEEAQAMLASEAAIDHTDDLLHILRNKDREA